MGDMPSGGPTENGNGDSESPSWDGYSLSQRTSWVWRRKRDGERPPQGKAAKTSGGHELGGPVQYLP